MHDSSTPASTAMTGRLTNVVLMLINVSDDGTTTTLHSLYIGYFPAIAIGVTILSPVVRKTTTQIHWPNCEIMLSHRLRCWANNVPTKTLEALIIDLITNIIVNIIISEHLLKT